VRACVDRRPGGHKKVGGVVREIVFRVTKALLVAAVTFGSVWSISGSVKIGLIAALIPAVLGSLSILSGFAYGLAGLSLIVAVALYALPQEWVDAGRRLVGQVVTQIEKSQ
jgi:hypothetical protein